MINSFSVGDRVIVDSVIEDTNEYLHRCAVMFGSRHRGAGVGIEMRSYVGKEALITHATTIGRNNDDGSRLELHRYRISIDNGEWHWDDAMLLSADDFAFDLEGADELI